VWKGKVEENEVERVQLVPCKMEEVVNGQPIKKKKKSFVRRKHLKDFGIEKCRKKSFSINPFRTIFSFPIVVKEYLLEKSV